MDAEPVKILSQGGVLETFDVKQKTKKVIRPKFTQGPKQCCHQTRQKIS